MLERGGALVGGLEKRGVEEMCVITRVGGARREGEHAWGGSAWLETLAIRMQGDH